MSLVCTATKVTSISGD